MFTFSRKSIITIGATLLVVLDGTVVAADTRPNILFIMSDDHAIRAVSAYGSTLVETPNIDRIAASIF